MTTEHIWRVGEPSPAPELTASPGAGWHVEPGLLLVSDEVAADDLRDFDSGRVHLTAHGPIVALTLQGQTLAIDFLGAHRDDIALPEWADPALATAGSRATFLLVLVDVRTQLIVGMRAFTVSPHLTRALRTEVQSRWTRSLDDAELIAASTSWQQTFPGRGDVRAGAIASSRLGD